MQGNVQKFNLHTLLATSCSLSEMDRSQSQVESFSLRPEQPQVLQAPVLSSQVAQGQGHLVHFPSVSLKYSPVKSFEHSKVMQVLSSEQVLQGGGHYQQVSSWGQYPSLQEHDLSVNFLRWGSNPQDKQLVAESQVLQGKLQGTHLSSVSSQQV